MADKNIKILILVHLSILGHQNSPHPVRTYNRNNKAILCVQMYIISKHSQMECQLLVFMKQQLFANWSETHSPLTFFAFTTRTSLSLLGLISVILNKSYSGWCMFLFDIRTTFRGKTMSEKSGKIFWRQLKLCWTENLVRQKIMPNKNFFWKQKLKKTKDKQKKVQFENWDQKKLLRSIRTLLYLNTVFPIQAKSNQY